MSGSEVKEKLSKIKISQVELASRLGETAQNVSSMLAAKDIKTGVLMRISQAVNKPASYFFEDDPQIDRNILPPSITDELMNPLQTIDALTKSVLNQQALIESYRQENARLKKEIADCYSQSERLKNN